MTIDFGLLQTPDYVGGGINALQAGQKVRQARERQNVLSGYGADPTGTRNALLGMGDIETAGQLQGMENDQVQMERGARREEREVAQDDRQKQESDLKRAAALNGLLLNGVRSVASVPEAQRDEYFASRIAPEMLQMGVPKETIDRFASGKKDDQSLTALGQFLGQQSEDIKYQFVNLGNGGVARGNPKTGDLTTLREPAPDFKAFGADQNVYEVGGSPAGGTGAGGPMIAPDAFPQVLASIVPGAQISSGKRSAERNAAVGGSPNSHHLTGHAFDIVPPAGLSMADLEKQLRGSGIPFVELINEGDHVHVALGSGAQAQPGEMRQVQVARPKAENAPAGYRAKPDGTLEFIPGGPADPATVGAKAQQTQMRSDRTFEGGMRDDFRNEPDVKAFRDVDASYRQVKALASRPKPTSADDTALTFSFMKMLDPGSVVREGEFALVGRGAGLPDQVIMALAMVDQGKVLTPQIRKNLIGAAETVYKERKGAFDSVAGNYRQIAKDSGVDPESVVRSDQPASAGGRPAAFANIPEPQFKALQQFKGSGQKAGQERNPFVPRNAAEFKALPNGAWYIDDDGSVHQKGR